MRCPFCRELRKTSSTSRISQRADNEQLRPNEFTDQAGQHYHDPRVWTAQLACSEGHQFAIEQRVPCTVARCDWNTHEKARPVLVAADQQHLEVLQRALGTAEMKRALANAALPEDNIEVPGDDELEKDFPGFKVRVAQERQKAAGRAAMDQAHANAVRDDAVAAKVAAGELMTPAEVEDLTDINARLALRGRATIA